LIELFIALNKDNLEL
jgi:hypothetical protein